MGHSDGEVLEVYLRDRLGMCHRLGICLGLEVKK